MQYFWRLCVIAIATASFAQPVYADLAVSPESVTIAGNRFTTRATTFTLSSDKPIQQLRVRVSDLRRADGAAVIPADKITIEPEEKSVSANTPEQVKLTVNFADATASGEFTGSLFLYHADGRQVIPLTARIKADPVLAWAVMIGGVLLGTGLSIYRSEGRSRDEVVIQVGRLRNQMRADSALDSDFKTSIEAKLVDVESALEDKAWETAQADVLGAKQLWNRWRKGREDWIAQLAYREGLVKQIQSLPKNILYTQQVEANWENIQRRLRQGNYETPQSLSDDFSKIRRQITQFLEGNAFWEELDALRKEIGRNDAAQERLWQSRLAALETELYNLQPGIENEPTFQVWKESALKLRDEMVEVLKQQWEQKSDQVAPELIITGRSGGLQQGSNLQLEPVPNVSGPFEVRAVEQAQIRQSWFNWTARSVAIAFLAWAGMTQIYSSNPTFGADPMRDYLALLAWGFGAEVTRESVIKAAQDLGLSLTK